MLISGWFSSDCACVCPTQIRYCCVRFRTPPLCSPRRPHVKFLIVDDNPDHCFFFSKTLRRKFPDAVLIECQTVESAISTISNNNIDLIVAHRTPELRGADLIAALRKMDLAAPIIAVSSMGHGDDLLAAGASRFHLVDEWLLIGNAAADLLKQHSAPPIAASS